MTLLVNILVTVFIQMYFLYFGLKFLHWHVYDLSAIPTIPTLKPNLIGLTDAIRLPQKGGELGNMFGNFWQTWPWQA